MMKRTFIRGLFSVVAALFVASATAAGKVEVTGDTSHGTVTSTTEGVLVTVTVTPAEGYYIRKSDITATKAFMPVAAAPRHSSVPVADELTLVGADPEDLSQARTYTITLPGEEYDVLLDVRYFNRNAITESMVSLSETVFVYNGKEQRPTVFVRGLTENKDYTLTYSNLNSQETGEYTVTVKGRSAWSGTITRTYKIFAGGKVEVNNSITGGTIATAIDGLTVTLTVTPADGYYIRKEDIALAKTYMPVAVRRRTIPVDDLLELTGEDPADLSQPRTYTAQLPGWEYSAYVDATFIQRQTITSAMVTLSASSFVYNGRDQKPVVTVRGLTEGQDYLLDFVGTSWSDVGTYSLTVTGHSTWKGVVTKTYTITKAPSVVTVAPEPLSLTYTGAPQTLIAAGDASGGTLLYSLDNSSYQTTLPEKTAAGSYTVYYKVQGDANHEDTDVLSIIAVIGKKDIVISGITAQDKVYDGTTAVTLNYDAVVFGGMAEGDVLTVTAKGTFGDANVSADKEVVITELTLDGSSIANYQLAENGQQTTATATITPKGIEGAVLSDIAAQPYTGEPLTPAVSVALDDTLLTLDTDYRVEYANNVNVGEATLTVTGIANYQGNVQTTFTITSVMAVVTTAPQPQTLVYSSEAQQLVTAGEADGGKMVYSLDGIDYQEAIPTGIDARSYTVYYKVQGDSNHTDSDPACISVTISPREVLQPTILLSTTDYTYNGTTKEPDVTVMDGEAVIDASEYTVVYANNINAGEATVTITDREGGNYMVNGSTSFTISKVPSVIALEPQPVALDYSGEAQALVAAGEAEGGTLVYSLDGELFTTGLPVGTEAGVYTVFYKVQGDDNHNDTEAFTLKSSITPVLVDESGTEVDADFIEGEGGDIEVVINTLSEDFWEETSAIPTTVSDEEGKTYEVTQIRAEAFEEMPSDIIVVLPEKMSTTEGVTNVINGDGTCETLDLTEVSGYNVPIDVEVETVVYDREVTGGSTTICLPYDLPVPENTTAYVLDDTDSEGVTLKECDGILEANQPYVLVVEEAVHARRRAGDEASSIVNLGTSNVTISSAAEQGSVVKNNFTLRGTVHSMTHEEGLAKKAYILQPDRSWRMTASSDPVMAKEQYLAPFQAYLIYTGEGELETVSTTFGESETTDIRMTQSIDMSRHTNSKCYDIFGRERDVKSSAKGLYIIKGKKIVIK